jgi:hypothetical protein
MTVNPGSVRGRSDVDGDGLARLVLAVRLSGRAIDR